MNTALILCAGYGKRLRPKDVVGEFENYLHDELDLVREAANAAQLKRNFKNNDLLQIPDMIWEFCKPDVIVMETHFKNTRSYLGCINHQKWTNVDKKKKKILNYSIQYIRACQTKIK